MWWEASTLQPLKCRSLSLNTVPSESGIFEFSFHMGLLPAATCLLIVCCHLQIGPVVSVWIFEWNLKPRWEETFKEQLLTVSLQSSLCIIWDVFSPDSWMGDCWQGVVSLNIPTDNLNPFLTKRTASICLASTVE